MCGDTAIVDGKLLNDSWDFCNFVAVGRILCIDYGRRRCGLAATDTLRLVASALTTVATADLVEWVARYVAAEPVDEIVVGLPRDMQGNLSESMTYIRPGIGRLSRRLPDIPIVFFDERFTSTLAHRAMIDGGMKKMKRRDKGVVDGIAAVIILTGYLESKQYQQNNPNI